MDQINYNSDNIPAYLKNQRRWALSLPGQINFYGKPFSPKAPLFPVNGHSFCRGLKPNDAGTWLEFAEVEAAQVRLGGYAGVMLGPDIDDAGGDLIGFDFDLAKADPKYREWVEQEVLPRCPGYVERSPSGAGYRVLIRGTILRSRKTPMLEIYDRHRFLRLTGDMIERASDKLTEPQKWIDWVYGTLPQSADVERTAPLDDVAAIPDPSELALLYQRFRERIAAKMPDEVANLDRIDGGAGDGDSNDARSAVIIFAKCGATPPEALGLLLGMEAIQRHAVEREGSWEKGKAELERRFRNYWWTEAEQVVEQWRENEAALKIARASVQRTLQATLARQLAERAATSATIDAAVLPGASQKVIPKMLQAPNTWLFNLVRAELTGNVIGQYSADWIEINTLAITGLIVSHIAMMSGSRTCPLMVVGAGSGEGKSSFDDMVLDLRLAAPELLGTMCPLDGIASGEGLRDAIFPNIMTLLSSEECGSTLWKIATDAPGFESAGEYLAKASNKRQIERSAKARNRNLTPADLEPKTNFLFSAMLSTQTYRFASIYTEKWIEDGLGARFPLFIPMPPPIDVPASAYNGNGCGPRLAAVANAVGVLWKDKQFVNFKTKELAMDPDFYSRTVAAASSLKNTRSTMTAIRRMPELALKWAVVHAMSRLLEPRDSSRAVTNLSRGASWAARESQLELAEEDLAFGLNLVKYTTRCMSYACSIDGAALEGDSGRKCRIVTEIIKEAKLRAGQGHTTIQPSEVADNAGAGHSRRGRPKAGAVRTGKVTKIEVEDVFAVFVGQGSLGTARHGTVTSYIMGPKFMDELQAYVHELQTRGD